jgi:hypothetical protein
MNTRGIVMARLRPEADEEPAGTTRSKSETAGRVAMVLALVLLVAAGAVSAYAYRVQPSDRRARSKINLRQVLMACQFYAQDNGNQFPPSLEVLYPKYLDDREVLGLPAPGQSGASRYTLVPPAAGATSGPQAVVCETEADSRGGRNVGWSDGSVTWVRSWQPAAPAGAE